MRTTLDLEEPILEELKSVQRLEGGSLGRVASRLLADALTARRNKEPKLAKILWKSRRMGALVDLADKDALYRILERE
jgi:ABC-type cobalamin transport system ATPase subunit